MTVLSMPISILSIMSAEAVLHFRLPQNNPAELLHPVQNKRDRAVLIQRKHLH